MADVKAPALGKPVYNGTHGNVSLAHNNMTLKAQADGSNLIMLDVPIGTRITGMRLINEALGGSVVIQPFIRFKDGTEQALFASAAVSAAKVQNVTFKPVMIADSGPAELVVKVTGAAATGRIDVYLEYIAEGY